MKKKYSINPLILVTFLVLLFLNFSAFAQSKTAKGYEQRSFSNRISSQNIARNSSPSPTTLATTTITACDNYTWPVTGLNYTISGIYGSGGGITQLFNNQTDWDNSATTYGATVAFNNLAGIPAATSITISIGSTSVNFSAPSGMYSNGTFLGSNNPQEPITISFSPSIYGVAGNFFVTNISDNVISGDVTATYSDGAIDSRTVNTDTETFGYFSTTPLTNVVLTTSSANRFISLKNLSIATNPASADTLDLTIITPTIPTFTPITPICSGSPLTALPTTSNNGVTGTWSPALDNTTTTTYTFTPDSGQCATTTTTTINVFPLGSNSRDVTACNSYTWPITGITYTASGSYSTIIPLTDTTVIDDFSLWLQHAFSFNATVDFNDLSTVPATNPTNFTLGTTNVTMSAPGGMYSGPDFLGTANPNNPITITFNPPVYGVSANYFTTDISDTIISGNITVTYSNGNVQSRTVTTNTDTFGYFDNNLISSIVISTTTTSPNRYVSIKNLAIATNPTSCSTETLNLTINTVPPPGDKITTAIDVSTPNYSTTGNNLSSNCYTDTIGEVSPDVWYKVNLDACAQSLSLNTCTGSNFDTIIRVFAQDGTTQLAVSDDDCGTTRQSSISNLDVSSVDIVYVLVEGYVGLGEEEGIYGLNITQTLLPQTVPAFSAVAPICNGDSLSALPTTSNNGISGSWSPALDNTLTTTYTFTPNPEFCATTASLTITVNQPVTPTFTAVAPICNGDSLSALPTTSNNGYTGAWSPALDNTATTTYTFTPDSGQCATTASLTITVNQPVTPTFTAVAPICNGDSLSALPTTSNNGYTGSWSPALDNTATTTYTFTPDSGQCATTASLTITVNQPVTPTFTAVAPICNGDSLSALPTTSNNGYIGSWSPALDNTVTTSYTFTPTAGQCATTASLTITVNQPVTPTFTAVTAICNGDSLSALPTTSNNGYTGAWSPALDNTATTTYTFTPDSGQCAISSSITIIVNPLTTTGSITTSICAGESYTWPANGITYTTAQSGITVVTGCNTATLNLSITPLTTTGSVTTSICAGESYTWPANGITYTTAQSGVTVVTGCNTATLNLSITPLTTTGSVTTSICAGESYTWPANGVTYTTAQSGVTVVTGCNTATLNLSITPLTTTGSVTTSICAGESYTWPANGITYTTAQSVVTVVTGCNTATLNLSITPLTTTGSVTTSICAGESYTWPANGITYTTAQSGVTVVTGCNTATLNLSITPLTTTGSVTTSICAGDSYTWPANGVTYTTAQSGITVVTGCNTATLNLSITPLTTTGSVTTSICAGDSYTWPANGITYTTAQSGVTVVTGCNTATLNLSITPLTTTGSVTTSICAGESYTWPANGVTYTTAQSGVTVVTGCNTATLNLSITPLTTTGSVTTSICAGESYTWPANGVTYTTAQSGVTVVTGCNTATLNLSITPLTTTGSVTTSICAGESYTWPANGVTYTTAQSGVTVVTGCNTATLNLSITPLTTTGSVTTSICPGDSYTWPANGVTYTTSQSGVTVVTGCNIATLNISITSNTTNGSVTTSICAGESYTWPANGVTYTTAQSGVTVVTGCNTATLNLSITPLTTTGSVTTSICAGESYTWPANGVTYTTAQSGVTVVTGCNTATLNLSITPLTTTGSVTTSICAGESYTWPANGITYTTAQSGVTVVTGCNTATLNLSITPLTTTGSVTTSICAGESYTWPANGITYTTAQSSVTVVTGCNTATLNLSITPLTTTGSVTTSICAGESYTWPANGVTYTTAQSGVTLVTGCNTATLNLSITPLTTTGSVTTSICAGESYSWPANGVTYTTAQSGITVVTGCNTATLNLTINSASIPTGNTSQSFDVANLNDATIANLVVNPNNVVWYGSLADAQAGTNALASSTVLTTGNTYYAVNVVGSCSSAPFAVTVTVTLGNDEFDNLNFTYYPNPTSSIVTISYSKNITQVTLINLLGQTLMTEKTDSTEVQVDLSRLAEATYFIKVASDDKEKIIKVIKKR